MLADACPECGIEIAHPKECVGMWSGAGPNGKPAGGGVYELHCPCCGIRLVAFENLYDETGQIPERGDDWEDDLYWERESSF
jgi:hypothetical protein